MGESTRTTIQPQSVSARIHKQSSTILRCCSCGQHTIAGGECTECRKKRESTIDHTAVTPAYAQRVTSLVDHASSSSTRQFAAGMQGDRDSRFVYDFSQVPAHTDGKAAETDPLPIHTEPELTGRYFAPTNIEDNIANLTAREFHCPPRPDSVKNTAGVGGAGTLGFTKIDSSSKLTCIPKFAIDAKAGTGTLQHSPVSLSLTSKFAKAEPLAPTGITMPLPECGKKDIPIFSMISPAISALVQAGEQEHCDDLSRAFKQTLEPCAAAMNKLAGQKFPGKTEGECFKALVAKLGFNPLDCTDEFIRLSKKTGERDDQGMHNFDQISISKSCDRIVIGYTKSSTNKIGDPSVAPNKFIPSATKCPGSTPAPSPSPSPMPSVPPSPKPVPPVQPSQTPPSPSGSAKQ